MSQAKVFLAGEADAYHARNVEAYAKYRIEDDLVATMIERNGIKPTYIVDLGCASGERLSALSARYGSPNVAGVDASQHAIDAARGRSPAINWLVADWTSCQFQGADLVITSYVWHWVDRQHLLRAMHNVQSSIDPGGHLVINDFWSNADVPYKHAAGVTTYKRKYDELFLAVGAFEVVDRQYYFYPGSSEQAVCSLLRRTG